MARGKVRNLKDGFTQEEEKIVSDFLAGKSIRAIAKEGTMGRTAIKNLLINYGITNPELKEKIDELLYSNKNHKSANSENSQEILSEEISEIYNQIMSGEKTLTQVSLEKGKTRDYVKRRIYSFLDDEQKIKEFDEKLKDNQFGLYDKLTDYFFELSDEEKKEVLFNKLNSLREKQGRAQYKMDLLERKFNRIKKYFLEERSNKQLLREHDLWKMLYNTPGLLAYSLSDKIKPAMSNLDKNENIGEELATHIIIEDASILGSSISRTNLQIQILVDNGLLECFLRKPRYFRTSPELIYSLIKFGEEKKSESGDIFLTEKELANIFGVTPEFLKQKYNVETEYGYHEYFDK